MARRKSSGGWCLVKVNGCWSISIDDDNKDDDNKDDDDDKWLMMMLNDD